jgi:hypothetical protein
MQMQCMRFHLCLLGIVAKVQVGGRARGLELCLCVLLQTANAVSWGKSLAARDTTREVYCCKGTGLDVVDLRRTPA